MSDPILPPEASPAISQPNHRFNLVMLTLAAGGADAAGYLGLGKIFTANMTGNIVLLGIAVGQGQSADSERALFALLAFVVGACIGGWLCSRVGGRRNWAPEISLVVGCEAALLLVFAIFWAIVAPDQRLAFVYPLIALLGLAMGLQSAAAHRLGVPGVVTTVVTGTLTSLLTGIMKAAPGPHPETPPDPPPFGLQTMVILAYGVGAAISAVIMLHARTWAGFFPAAIVALVVMNRLFRRA